MTEIINIGGSMVNNFIIKNDKGIIIVDSGYPNGFPTFKKRFEKLGYKASDIKFLFLTHCHDDHTGFLKELMEYTNAPLILHPVAVERLRAGMNGHTHGASYKLMQFICRTFIKEKYFPAVDNPSRYLIFDGAKQYLIDAGMEGTIINLPGHTADSIGINLNDGRILCGDVVMNMPIAIKNYPLVLENLEELQKSWDYLINNGKIIVTSHGKPVSVQKLIKNRHYMDNKNILKVYK